MLYVGSIDWCTTLATYGANQPGKLKGKEALPWTGSNELRAPFGGKRGIVRQGEHEEQTDHGGMTSTQTRRFVPRT